MPVAVVLWVATPHSLLTVFKAESKKDKQQIDHRQKKIADFFLTKLVKLTTDNQDIETTLRKVSVYQHISAPS